MNDISRFICVICVEDYTTFSVEKAVIAFIGKRGNWFERGRFSSPVTIPSPKKLLTPQTTPSTQRLRG